MRNVSLFGVPRSGTSWLAHIFNSHPDVALRFQPLFSYGHRDSLSVHSSGEAIRAFFQDILHTSDEFALMEAEAQKNYPSFRKAPRPTHIVFKETRYLHLIGNMLNKCSDIRIIGIVRNPLSVLASWISAPKEFRPEWDITSEWRGAPSKNEGRPENFFGFEKWKESTRAFLSYAAEYPDRFLMVRYDDLNRSPFETTERLFHFCGLTMTVEVKRFLTESKSRHDPDPYSVFRSNASDRSWRAVLPPQIAAKVITELEGSGLDSFLEQNP